MSKLVKAHLALFIVNLIYGANYLIAKGLMPSVILPNAFILIRVLGATFLFWLIYLFNYQKVKSKDLLMFAVCALFGVAINQLFFFNGLMRTSPLNSSIIMTTTPIIVFVLSIFMLKEKPLKTRVVGIVLGAIGSILLTSMSKQNMGTASLLGDSFIFINALSYAFYLVLIKPYMQRYSPITVSAWVFLFGLIFVLFWPDSTKELSLIQWENFTIDIYVKISFVIVGVTFFTYLLNVYALKMVSPSVNSSYIYLQPVLAGVFIYLSYLMNEDDYTGDFSIWKVLCTLLIFVGVYLVSIRKIKSK